jgi:hypothetical protein
MPRSRKAAVETSRGVGGGLANAQKKRAGAWAIDFVRISQKAPSGRFMRRPLNLNSHNHNQRDRRPRFSLAVLKNRAFPTMPYFPCTQSCGNNTPQTRRHSSRTELGIELQRIRTASAERMTARVRGAASGGVDPATTEAHPKCRRMCPRIAVMIPQQRSVS